MNLDSQNFDLAGRLALALALGLLLGIERGWRERDEPAGGRTAGIRTFALLGLAGGLAAALSQSLNASWAAALLIAVIGACVARFYYREFQETKSFSSTTAVAAFIALLLGAFAVVGERTIAAAAGVGAVALLAARESLHGLLKRLTWDELRAGVLLLAMSFVALPLLPDRTIDPWDALNPHELWLMTIAIAAISTLGYAAVRIAGPARGLLFGALAGGIVSSTAVTLDLARRAPTQPAPLGLACAAGLACAVSYVRTFAIAAAVVPDAMRELAFLLLPAALVTAVAAMTLWRSAGATGEDRELRLRNPLELRAVFGFAALLTLVRVASKLVLNLLGTNGFIAVAAIGGFADADPVVLSAGAVARQGAVQAAVLGVVLAVGANALSKAALALGVGGKIFGLWFALLTALAIAAFAAGAGLWLQL
jgi:uncharacterized membrane protein (DUF4010 family)